MKHSKKIISFLVYLFAVFFAIGQKNDRRNLVDAYHVTHWGLNEGLSQGETYQFLKDVYGFLWIGTRNGLCRFDGSKFKIYYHDPKDSRSIGHNVTTLGMVEDSLHNIWIATHNDFVSTGLARYDIKADTFTNFLPVVPGTIEPFWANKDEVWCLENDSLISSYNIHSYQRKVVTNLSPYNGKSVGNGVSNKFYETKSNSVWSLCGMPGNKDRSRFGLLQISLADGDKKFYDWPCYRKIPGHNHESEGFRYDEKRNCVWINSNDGLIKFSLNDKQFHFIEPLNALPDLKDYLKDYDLWHWVDIDLDNRGRVWLATVQKGLVIYNPDDQSVSLPFNNDPALHKEISDYNAAIYCDRDGVVWAGSWMRKGVYQLYPFSAAVTRFTAGDSGPGVLNDNDVNSAESAGNGKVWLGTTNGLNIFDPLTNSFTVFSKDSLHGISGNYIRPRVINTESNKAWLDAGPVGDAARTYEMDRKTGKCREIIFKDMAGQIVTNPFAKFIIPYQDGCLAVLSSNSQQTILYQLTAGSPEAKLLLNLPSGKRYLFPTLAENDRWLYLKAIDEKENLSFELVNNQWTRRPTLLDSINWNRIFYNEKDESYWVAGNGHLLHYNKNLLLLKDYSKEDGIPVFRIQNIICDHNNNPWFNTDRSIHQLNLKTGTVIKLAEKDGFQSQHFFERSTAGLDDYGNIYFPAGYFGTGFDKVSPQNLNSMPSSIYLGRLEINQKPFASSNFANSLHQLSLRYFENKITIETGVLDFYSKGTSSIRYKLEGGSIKNTAWQYAPAYYTIRYEELPPGEYKLSIQASNAGNEFNGPVKTLLINISPAFWQTWWFRMLAIAAVIGIVYSFIQYRSRSLKKRNLQLEQKVTVRTNELNNSLSQLKNTQEQLIHSEKMASLGELSSGIAHEIKNPLNFITNFSELNMELITEIEEEQIPTLSESKQAEVAPIIKILKKNSEKINHHGKRVDEIVRGMLQHSRLANVSKEAVNINSLCEESLKLAYHGFKAREKTFNASFEKNFDPNLPNVMAIPQDIGRVLLNLINNAFYAVNEKKKKIQSNALNDTLQSETLYKPSVIVSTQKNGGNKICITVSDNGMGIPPRS